MEALNHRRRMIAIMVSICILLSLVALPPQTVYAKNQSGIVTAKTLNVRTGAGTNYDKLMMNGVNVYLVKDQKVTITKQVKDWYYITFQFQGKSGKGYVSSDYIKIEKTTTSGTKQEVTPTPSPSAGNQSSKDTKVYSKGLTVAKDIVQIDASINTSILNLRSKASTSGAIITKLSLGTFVQITNELLTTSGKWYKIQVEDTDEVGYVLSDYVTILFEDTVKGKISSTAKIYPRKTASATGAYVKDAKSKKIGLSNAKAITILSEKTVKEEKWFHISFQSDNKSYKGYVKADYVKFKQTEKATATPTPTPKPTKEPTPEVTPTPTAKPTKAPTPSITASPTPTPVAKVQAAQLNTVNTTCIFQQPGFGKYQVTDASGRYIYLVSGKTFAVYESFAQEGYDWCLVGVQQDNTIYYGYILKEYVNFQPELDADVASWAKPDGSNGNGATESGNITVTPTPTPYVALTNEEFEAKLTKEGFPESYKASLRKLHERYPLWEFEAHQTGLDWSQVIAKESSVGTNLISNAKSVEWKSLLEGAYRWKDDKFIPFDGSTWVTASEEAVAYYMDPRNFLTEKGIFQFELLSYRSSYQDVNGVENILKNTALSNCTFTYTDANGVKKTSTYAQAFIEAAKYSNVSPFHLATRVKQEVVTGKNTLSSSVSGTVSGYEGLYNFYNIGAYHSTEAGGAVKNGLEFALHGTGNASLDAQYMIPWNNPYNAIVGGAYNIGRNYINRGGSTYRSQDTVYLQKFNVTNKTTYGHQYMANVEAAYAESQKMYAAYEHLSDVPIVFSIPVYKNMPSKAVAVPTKAYNPNNWLKTLKITDSAGENLLLTPTFDMEGTSEYSLIVENEIDSITITASTVSSKAKIQSGTGTYPLTEGVNQLQVLVVAENGDIRTYVIHVVRQ